MRQATARALGPKAIPGCPARCPEEPEPGKTLGRSDASSAPLDGWDWLCCEPAETDLDEATGPGTGNLAGHTFQNLQEGLSPRIEADLPMEEAAETAAVGLGSQEAGSAVVAPQSARTARGREGFNLEGRPSSRVAAGLIERVAQEATDGADGLEVLPVAYPQGSTELVGGEVSGASCLNLEEGLGSEVLSPSRAFPRGFLASCLQPSGTFVSRGAGLLSQARARAKAFALLPGFGLGLRRSPLPRRLAESGTSEVLL